MFYFYHFQTLSGKLTAFWHILYGKIVKSAFYMSKGKKRFCFEKLIFFHHLPPWAGSFPGFVERSFASFSKVQFWWLNQQLEETVFFPETFSDQCHTLSKKIQPFWGIFFAWQPKVHSTCPMDLLNNWKKTLFLEKSLFYAICGHRAKKTRLLLNVFRRGFQICNHRHCKQNLSEKAYVSKTALWYFCTMTFNVRPFGEN